MISSQATVLEDSSTLKFFDVFINSWDLYVSAEEIIEEILLEIPDVASCAALLVFLSEALALLWISSGSETCVTGGPLGFALVLGLLEDTLFQWSRHIDDYNQNSVQALSIIKVRIYVISQGRWVPVSSPENNANLLSLQETPLGCSSRIPGNLQCVYGFLIWIKSVDVGYYG